MCAWHADFLSMARLILNCDLGENESAERTEQLIAQVDAANICCGVHAGSIEKTRMTLEQAKHYGVIVGAHPGLAIEGGRGVSVPSVEDLKDLLGVQVGGFLRMASEVDVPVRYVKLHGALYHAVESDPELARAYLDCVEGFGAGLGIFSLAGGACAQAARRRELKVWKEAFADRGYTLNGQLVPRGEPDALLDAAVAVQRLEQWAKSGMMRAVTGETFPLRADTLCVHSDSPDALAMLQRLRNSMPD